MTVLVISTPDDRWIVVVDGVTRARGSLFEACKEAAKWRLNIGTPKGKE